jgi:hypothetical protein
MGELVLIGGLGRDAGLQLAADFPAEAVVFEDDAIAHVALGVGSQIDGADFLAVSRLREPLVFSMLMGLGAGPQGI